MVCPVHHFEVLEVDDVNKENIRHIAYHWKCREKLCSPPVITNYEVVVSKHELINCSNDVRNENDDCKSLNILSWLYKATRVHQIVSIEKFLKLAQHNYKQKWNEKVQTSRQKPITSVHLSNLRLKVFFICWISKIFKLYWAYGFVSLSTYMPSWDETYYSKY